MRHDSPHRAKLADVECEPAEGALERTYALELVRAARERRGVGLECANGPDMATAPQIHAPASKKTPLVVSFASLQQTDTAIAGGKGANLGELTSAGLPVPAGFVVTADAYLHAM
jgi:hypothetical protein